MSDSLRELPTSFDQYVGQEDIKRRLNVYIREAIETDKALPHVLLTTTPGQGKTALAHVIAHELKDPMVILDITQFATTGQLLSFMRRFRGGIIFIDEIHRGAKQALEGLLTMLEENYLPTPGGGRFEIKVMWTMIAATTNPEILDKLAPALTGRFPIRPEFAPYTDEEATEIILGMGARAEVRMPREVAEGLGKAAAGTPRMGRDLVMAYRALSRGCDPTVEEVLDLVGLDPDGLSKAHRDYLLNLDKLDGVAGETNLRNILRLAPEKLRDVERVLFRLGYIGYSPRGRYLTGEGYDKVAELRPEVIAPARSSRRALVA